MILRKSIFLWNDRADSSKGVDKKAATTKFAHTELKANKNLATMEFIP